jgi:hypothetical protein
MIPEHDTKDARLNQLQQQRGQRHTERHNGGKENASPEFRTHACLLLTHTEPHIHPGPDGVKRGAASQGSR